MDIIQKFISLQGDKLIFPRFHQLDVVRKLIADVKKNGAGYNYLIQHSAGSGKSNSIAWTAYRLASLHDGNNTADKTYRRALDKMKTELKKQGINKA